MGGDVRGVFSRLARYNLSSLVFRKGRGSLYMYQTTFIPFYNYTHSVNRGIQAVGDSVKAESGKDFQLSEKFGYIHSCPTNLGTGMRASVHVDLPGWTKDSIDGLKARCEVLNVQPRGTRGESGGQTGM